MCPKMIFFAGIEIGYGQRSCKEIRIKKNSRSKNTK